MSRRNTRKNAFYLLFQLDFVPPDEKEESKRIFFEQLENPEQLDLDYIQQTVEGVLLHKDEIDAMIDQVAVGWSTLRMNKVDLAILRLAIYEMRFSQETPQKVAINEAVELAKKFSSDEAPSFINGILGKLS